MIERKQLMTCNDQRVIKQVVNLLMNNNNDKYTTFYCLI